MPVGHFAHVLSGKGMALIRILFSSLLFTATPTSKHLHGQLRNHLPDVFRKGGLYHVVVYEIAEIDP